MKKYTSILVFDETWSIFALNRWKNFYLLLLVFKFMYFIVFCLFGDFRPNREFSLIWRRHYLWRATNFDLCSALMTSNRESSLACHTYCDTDRVMQPFIMVISEDPWHSHLLPSVWQWSCPTCFKDLGLYWPGIKPRLPACEANALPLRHRGSGCIW